MCTGPLTRLKLPRSSIIHFPANRMDSLSWSVLVVTDPCSRYDVCALLCVLFFRYVVIVHPMRSRTYCTLGNSVKIIVGVWIAAILIASPSLHIMVSLTKNHMWLILTHLSNWPTLLAFSLRVKSTHDDNISKDACMVTKNTIQWTE